MSAKATSAEAASGRLAGRFVALGVTGSIAAYKAVELVRRLAAEGADVQVLQTRAAQSFVGPLTFETLTRRRVIADPVELLTDGRIAHVVVAHTVDAIVVAPATARWLAAMAAGLADDVITAACLASAAPVVVAPAMDGEMWSHPATRANVARLAGYGYIIVAPEEGPLASGQSGVGRLADLATVVEAVVRILADRPARTPDLSTRPPAALPAHERDLLGRHVVITAGGTAEPIDPVRFIGNHSSGKMGVAVTEAALARGAEVTLIAGTCSVSLPEAAVTVRATTAAAMRAAVLEALPRCDVLVMAAAVADFRPRRPLERKLERAEGLVLELEPTPDILAEVGRLADGLAASGEPGGEPLRPRPVLVGFAAETGSLERARGKLAQKRIDLLLANDVAAPGSGFGADTNRVTVFGADGSAEEWPLLSKQEVAHRLLDRVLTLLERRGAPGLAAGVARAAPATPPARS